MGKDNIITKVAIVGSTKLTLMSMTEIEKLDTHKILYVFGLSDKSKKAKVNSTQLGEFCNAHNIILDESEDWDNFYQYCTNASIDLIITLGDSRIVPKQIVNNFETIGNHGAILPGVQGGASLVWGRMLNYNYWNVAIMRIGEKVDSGEILKTSQFDYHDNASEQYFTTKADKETVSILIDVLRGDYSPIPNEKWQVRIAKHTDSYLVTQILKFCLDNNIPVYLPPRTPTDANVKSEWPEDFIEVFKKANNDPYPKWRNQ